MEYRKIFEKIREGKANMQDIIAEARKRRENNSDYNIHDDAEYQSVVNDARAIIAEKKAIKAKIFNEDRKYFLSQEYQAAAKIITNIERNLI